MTDEHLTDNPDPEPTLTLEEKAQIGDAEAQCKLALLFEVGLQGTPNYEKAAFWWRQAANQGSGWALEKLALLIKAKLIPGSDKDALELSAKARDAGYRGIGESLRSDPPKSPEENRVKGAAKKVLVVEDEEVLRQLLQILLTQAGFQVVMAENGQNGIETISQNPDIALIICDLQMPKMNGFQFVQTLRNINAVEGIPIVIVTAFTKPEYVEKGKKLGIQAWLMKPFTNDRLIGIAQELLKVG